MSGFDIDCDIGERLAFQLRNGHFSDIVVELADGDKLCAHRVLLASSSDLLTQMFKSQTADASESIWRPGVGSAPAWRWIIGWMYGSPEPLPLEFFVEVLVIAVYFELQNLLDKLTALDYGDRGRRRLIALQILEADNLEALAEVAAKSVPSVVLNDAVVQKLFDAKMENVAIFVKHLHFLDVNDEFVRPCSHEETFRLKLLGAKLQIEEASEFPDCFVDAVRWDAFPGEVLKRLMAGDLCIFERVLGRPALGPAPAGLQERAIECLTSRCIHLEKNISSSNKHRLSLGVFGKLHAEGHEVRVTMSSQLSPGWEAELVSPTRKHFGTNNQSSANTPWISLTANGAMIYPEAVGVMHGCASGEYVCTCFVVEGSVGEEGWETIRRFTATPLSDKGQVLEVHELPAENISLDLCNGKCYFDSFRMRMTGPNSDGNWHLMVSWFDIFGHTKTRSVEAMQALSTREGSDREQNSPDSVHVSDVHVLM